MDLNIRQLKEVVRNSTNPDPERWKAAIALQRMGEPLLYYDGLYYAKDEKPEYFEPQIITGSQYLRFYPDGIVLNTYSVGEPKQVAKWFHKKHKYTSKGDYFIAGLSIHFSVIYDINTIDYQGAIDPLKNSIELTSYIHMTQHKIHKKYVFARVRVF